MRAWVVNEPCRLRANHCLLFPISPRPPACRGLWPVPWPIFPPPFPFTASTHSLTHSPSLLSLLSYSPPQLRLRLRLIQATPPPRKHQHTSSSVDSYAHHSAPSRTLRQIRVPGISNQQLQPSVWVESSNALPARHEMI